MNKLNALESYKASVIIEDVIKHLDFLDTLKTGMGQEMNEMMSEEISRVMGE